MPQTKQTKVFNATLRKSAGITHKQLKHRRVFDHGSVEFTIYDREAYDQLVYLASQLDGDKVAVRLEFLVE